MPVNYDPELPPDNHQLIEAVREVCPTFTEAFDTGMIRNLFSDEDVIDVGALLKVAMDYLVADLEKLGLNLVGDTNELMTNRFGMLFLIEARSRLDRENLIPRLSAMSEDERVSFETFVLGDGGSAGPDALERFLAWLAGRHFGSDLIGAMRYWLTSERVAANDDFHDYIQWCVDHVEVGADMPDAETIDAVADYMRKHNDMRERFQIALNRFRDEGYLEQDIVDDRMRELDKCAAANVRDGNFNPPSGGAHLKASYHLDATSDTENPRPAFLATIVAWMFSFTEAPKLPAAIRDIESEIRAAALTRDGTEISDERENRMLALANMLGETKPPPPKPSGDE